ncbi:carboxymuconolactone decarboxylase family protein [Pannonibacter carbonis]|uniref:carboxymuconolactone decarboxylase family protein n=1 Tax=Pannonibacter carbonis TaxID=2067569 RepID=UPI000D0EB12C|nr:carboxymuconolactone decarboxylase family protein [Pannonibacter carbonis]
MSPRLTNQFELAADAYQAMVQVEVALQSSGVDLRLLELVKLRVSQINGCAFCLDMHLRVARSLGENELRIQLLNAWRDSSLYSERERAALDWAECLTLLSDRGAPDEVYDRLSAQFDAREQSYLTFAIGAINLWNRLQVGFRAAHSQEALRVAG